MTFKETQTTDATRWRPSRREALAVLGAASAVIMKPGLATAAAVPGRIIALSVDRKSGALYVASERGVHRSADEGRSWNALAPMRPGDGVGSLSVSAAGDVYAVGSRHGVLRQDGAKWISLARGLPSRDVRAIAAHATKPETVYAYIAGRGIFRSEDAGGHWRLMDAGPRGGLTTFVHSDMAGSMQTGWLFAASPRGVRLSMDCFCGWRSGGDLPLPARAVTYEPGKPAHVVAAAARGLFDSSDGGRTWSALPDVGAPVEALAMPPGGVLYAVANGQLRRRQGGAWSRVDA
jgi:hypothetical protein